MSTQLTQRPNRSATERQSFGRDTNSPLPSVPLPAKTAPLRGTVANRLTPNNENQQSASCGDLLQGYTSDRINIGLSEPSVHRTSSTHFDQTSFMTQPLLPPNSNQDAASQRFCQGAMIQPLHDYEELPERYKTLERKVSLENRLNCQNMSVSGNQVSCAQGHKPSNGQNDFPKERQNPMYSGIRAVSPYPSVVETSANDIDKRAIISEKCACVLVIGFTVAIIISLLSLILIALVLVGLISPVTSQGATELRNEVTSLKLELKQLQSQVTTYQRETDNLMQQSLKVSELITRINMSISDQPSVPVEVRRYIQALNSSQFDKVFGSLASFFSSNCVHNSFGIGGSSSQESIESGEYNVEQGYTVTGATCSADAGYTGSLFNRMTPNMDGKLQMSYWCVCMRNSPTVASTGRKECRIHYWKCPSGPE